VARVIYRDLFQICLSCGSPLRHIAIAAGSYEKCVSCGGVWMEHGALQGMWAFMRPINPLVFHPRTTGRKERMCLRCDKPMERVSLGHGVPVDRCATHGIWFDPEELAVSLAAAALNDEQWHEQFTETVRRLS
jgi:Zn-finger nucleic acid-binding protein